MLATHSTKFVNAKAQQDAVCANIIDCLPTYYITSQSIKMTKKYWSCPRNAADINKYKATDPTINLPNIQDGRAVKQLLIPKNYKLDNYICVSPLESMGLLHELYLRLQDTDIQHKRFLLQPNVASWANHGELMVTQKGRVCLLPRGIANITIKNDKEMMVCATFTVQGANASSGFVAYGHPAITAVGGLVHTFERALGDDVDFAIGLSNIFHEHRKRASSYNTARKQTVWEFKNELTATLEISLLLKSSNLGALYQYLIDNPINSFAGGSVWDYRVFITDTPPIANYIVDSCKSGHSTSNDPLNVSLFVYDTEPPTHSINQVGYAFLETPTKRNHTRADYPHAWAEPIYAITKQDSFSCNAWWKRKFVDNHVVWIGEK